MTDIITPPKIYNGMVIYPKDTRRVDIYGQSGSIDYDSGSRDNKYTLTGLPVPLKLNKPISFNFYFNFSPEDYFSNCVVKFNHETLIKSFPDRDGPGVKRVTVTLPANTEIDSQDIYISVKDNLGSYDYCFIEYQNIEKITLTF